MKLDFAFVCDYAEVKGKINALGIGFDTIYAPQVPWTHPSFSFVMQLRASVVEVGEKRLEVRLIDEDGKNIMPSLRAKFVVPEPTAGTESVGRVALVLRNVTFPRYGAYSIHAIVDGHDMHDISFRVSLPPKAPQPQG